MGEYKEFGFKDGSFIAQVVKLNGSSYLVKKDETVLEDKFGNPEVKDKELKEAVLKQAETEA